MQIRRIDIESFRGVRKLCWTLPRNRTFFGLVGPGDATKSTILTAIDRCLSDRWNITFQDTDFHNGDIEQPIRIRIAVGGLPDDLMALDAFGSYLCGVYRDGRLTHDPQEDNETCVIVELRVEADLEPHWLAYRPGDSETEAHTIKASLRAHFRTFRIDERVDAHLRWSRNSALGRLTEKHHGTKRTLTAANRAAREAVAENVSPQLAALAADIQTKVQDIGSAEFRDLKPGLDMSLTNAQGNLALFDGPVPLMNFGLGTRRLAGAAAQQLAHEGSALLLIDEVEYGLEPHRLVHLLEHLREKDAYAQVFVTTHSPTALQHLAAADLVMVRSINGETMVRSLGDPASLQGVLRSTPEAFLSRRVVVTEGKTEYGLVLGLLDHWDRQPRVDGHVPSSALGVVAVEGNGGTGAAKMALDLLNVGYEVTLFIDSDEAGANNMVPDVEQVGGFVVQWGGEHCTEAAICAQLDADGLTDFIRLSFEVADDQTTAAQAHLDQLTVRGAPGTATQHDVASWLAAGMDASTAQRVIANTAKVKKWFKSVDRGKALAKFILARDELTAGPVADALADLREGVYEKRAISSADNEETSASADPAETSAPEGTVSPSTVPAVTSEAPGPDR